MSLKPKEDVCWKTEIRNLHMTVLPGAGGGGWVTRNGQISVFKWK